MLSSEEAKQILSAAEQIIPADVVSGIVKRMAEDISAALSDQYPLILSVMGGAVGGDQ